MIKKHRRSNSGWMRRTSRIFLTDLNQGKSDKLVDFLHGYSHVVQYFVEMFWSMRDFSSALPAKEITGRAVSRFGVTSRMAQMAAKQAKEMINSQRKREDGDRTMPLLRNVAVNLDQRFVRVSPFNGKFDWALKFGSGVPAMVVPVGNTKHSLKFIKQNWGLSKTVRLGLKKDRLYIDLIFEKEPPAQKIEGKVLGVDLGFRTVAATSDGQLIGTELHKTIKKSGKHRKSFHHFVTTETNRLLKTLDLSGVRLLVLEKLKNVKRGKRGKFSRGSNRLLSMWHYARAVERLEQICKEQGIRVEFKSPWKTSQRCPACGKIDRRNRSGDRFRCIDCGFEAHADIVGARNLELLGLAGAYSLGSLPSRGVA